MSFFEYLSKGVIPAVYIDHFLDPHKSHWVKFDSELGYIPNGAVTHGGLDGARVFYHYEPSGQRKMLNWPDRPCRINTYGNSFTECQQVSDGETWQEYLAAHFGEPIRNFGVGGYGVYQAYKRMMRMETSDVRSEYIILNIYDDDHRRSLMNYRGLLWKQFPNEFSPDAALMFHANPWTHLEFDLSSGNLVEVENRFSDTESLYSLGEADFIYETFKFDLVANLDYTSKTGLTENPRLLQSICDILNISFENNSCQDLRILAGKLDVLCGIHATTFILEKIKSWAENNHRKFGLLLSYGSSAVVDQCRNQIRFDEILIEYLASSEIPFFDSLTAHQQDYKMFNISPESYIKRYYNGHYSPAGNHYFAFAIKDFMLNWLDPSPPAYC